MAQDALRLTTATTSKSSKNILTRIEETHTQELFIPLCGPIGSPIHEVANSLEEVLKDDFGYECKKIRFSDLIRDYYLKLIGELNQITKTHPDSFEYIEDLIQKGNKLREKFGASILSEIAISRISIERAEKQQEDGKTINDKFRSRRVCYIFDSLKNKEELRILRSVYGDLLYFIGVFASKEKRVRNLLTRGLKEPEVFKLIDQDSGEEIAHGQTVRDIFHKADLFLRIENEHKEILRNKVLRFLNLVFGTKIITPTADETAMYIAASAAGNSACLSRQVGAALTDNNGEIISIGWNDVPKYKGDLYRNIRQEDQNNADDKRCMNIGDGKCFSDHEKESFAIVLTKGLLDEGIIKAEDELRVKKIFLESKDSKVRNMVEFSRAIHAEMHAIIMGAQKSGIRMKGGKLYCTTYPCHICARHIIVAGIEEVYYIEPYTKSLTTKLHFDAITENEGDRDKVRILMFDGVAPSRYLSLFKVGFDYRKEFIKAKVSKKDSPPIETQSLERIPVLESLVVQSLKEKGVFNEKK